MKTKRKFTTPAYEPATKSHAGTPHYAAFGKETDKQTPANPARDAAAALIAEGGPETKLHKAYAAEDPRYAGGDVFDLNNEQTGL
ncbi:MAG: hypothetical protein JWP58_4466 [Hymenobacter sp.]|nr:hypothetical protein [Hymenobacter sp.]